MSSIPTYSRFKLIAPLASVPAGATGQLARPDDHHVSLIFDECHHDDLVFDRYDTEPDVWAAIVADRPRRSCVGRAVAMAAAIAVAFFAIAEAIEDGPAAHAMTHVIKEILYF